MASQKTDSSEEDNELGFEDPMSGENDVEYAEFSLNFRTSPKEQIKNNANAKGSENAINPINDFSSLPITASTSKSGPNSTFLVNHFIIIQ